MGLGQASQHPQTYDNTLPQYGAAGALPNIGAQYFSHAGVKSVAPPVPVDVPKTIVSAKAIGV
jgi:hypothetical protein